ncbi:hypothetical protein [Halalkalibacter urbisdiaboli]|uniref:hypothetical protein n=1 Tax=Halalkalibacter urbisdiaboli TaxID=1960589 RepID=UPI0013FDDB73|nr:hypothetical protein [Halalkalibacter urbisdiaboli]
MNITSFLKKLNKQVKGEQTSSDPQFLRDVIIFGLFLLFLILILSLSALFN